jgi:hypothetical protein
MIKPTRAGPKHYPTNSSPDPGGSEALPAEQLHRPGRVEKQLDKKKDPGTSREVVLTTMLIHS